jgi:ABC-type nitrate/sulfonate/bicarbonate transport system permease component
MASLGGKTAVATDSGTTIVTLPRALRGLGWTGVSWLVVLILAAAWEGLARSGAVTAFMLPPLSVVIDTIWHDTQSGDLFVNLGLTLYRTLVGFVIATAAGIVLGIAMVRVNAVRWFFDPIISVGFPMPKIAFLPIVVLWLGFHDISKIAMVVFDAVFPVLTATIAAAGAVEKELLWSARSMGASDREMLHEVVLPAALPEILTGLQVALPIALIVCIVAEMLTGGVGLGGAMITASRFANSPGVFAGIVEIAVVGYCLVKGMSLARRRLLAWHSEAQAPSTV